MRKEKKGEKPPFTGDFNYSFSENFGSIIRKSLVTAAFENRMCLFVYRRHEIKF